MIHDMVGFGGIRQKRARDGFYVSRKRAVLQKVEELREQLHQQLEARSLSDPEVIVLSQKLDQALNTYQTLTAAKLDKHIAGFSKIMTKE